MLSEVSVCAWKAETDGVTKAEAAPTEDSPIGAVLHLPVGSPGQSLVASVISSHGSGGGGEIASSGVQGLHAVRVHCWVEVVVEVCLHKLLFLVLGSCCLQGGYIAVDPGRLAAGVLKLSSA